MDHWSKICISRVQSISVDLENVLCLNMTKKDSQRGTLNSVKLDQVEHWSLWESWKKLYWGKQNKVGYQFRPWQLSLPTPSPPPMVNNCHHIFDLPLRDVPATNNHRILKIEGFDLLSCPATAEIGWNWNDMQYVERDLHLILKQQACPHLFLTVTPLQPAETCLPQIVTNKNLSVLTWDNVSSVMVKEKKHLCNCLLTVNSNTQTGQTGQTLVSSISRDIIHVCVCLSMTGAHNVKYMFMVWSLMKYCDLNNNNLYLCKSAFSYIFINLKHTFF